MSKTRVRKAAWHEHVLALYGDNRCFRQWNITLRILLCCLV